jgi:SAM-dependent methyltransferase
MEKAIAKRLKQTSREERKVIYRTMYDTLFAQVPDHPRLKCQENSNKIAQENTRKLKLIKEFINPETVFVEFAPGDCRFSVSICDRVKFVYGVDISNQRGQFVPLPENFKLIIYDGYCLGMQENFADVVFSDQLIEHLHPDDTELHFRLVRKILKPQGVYIFRTPHRFSGPHDVSRYFSDEAEGFHLKEWTYGEIEKVLSDLKYSSWSGYWDAKGIRIKMPFTYFVSIEYVLSVIPKKLRKIASRYFLPCISIVAVK